MIVGRFAPSPTGPLHRGSLATALASWLDSRCRGGRWHLRVDDLDPPREDSSAVAHIVSSLRACGLHWDGDILWQSRRSSAYEAAWERLRLAAWIYPCYCSRKQILAYANAQGWHAERHREVPYHGACRPRGLVKSADRLDHQQTSPAWRVLVPDRAITIWDERCGAVSQVLGQHCGDFVVRRADGVWAYHLATVVDDAYLGVTDVMRGEDLLELTPRQHYLQALLAFPTPRYYHVAVVRDLQGEKLSKQTYAPALDLNQPLAELVAAARHLGLDDGRHWTSIQQALGDYLNRWSQQRTQGTPRY